MAGVILRLLLRPLDQRVNGKRLILEHDIKEIPR